MFHNLIMQRLHRRIFSIWVRHVDLLVYHASAVLLVDLSVPGMFHIATKLKDVQKDG